MSKKINIKKEALISLIRIITSVVIGFITVPLIIRVIGKSGYGVLTIVLTVTSYSALLQLGLGNTIVRYIAKYSGIDTKAEHQIVSMAFLFNCAIGLIALVSAVFLYLRLEFIFAFEASQVATAKTLFIIYSLDAIITLPFTAFYSYMKGHNQFSAFNTTLIIRTVLRFALIYVLFRVGFGIFALAVVDVALNQSINLFNFLYSRIKLKLRFDFHFKDKQLLGEIFLFTMFTFITQIIDYFYWRTDNVLLGIMTTTDTVAEYNAGQTIIQHFKEFATVISGVTLPTLSMLTNERDRESKINDFLHKTSHLQSMIIIPIILGFWLFGKQFLNVWLDGLGFENAYMFAMVIIVPLGIVLIQSTHVNMLFAMNKHRLRVWILLVSAVLNLVLSVFLVNRIGAVGAALGTGIMLFVGDFVAINFVYYKVIGFNVLKFYGAILPRMLLCCAPATIVGLLIRNITLFESGLMDLVTKCAVFGILYLLPLYFLQFKPEGKAEGGGPGPLFKLNQKGQVPWSN
ncbi:MAG: polysaccharide biosynthesis protein [Ruminiclostridium sp.]|nr:polysaccharide biosynthesis protein [Ruminiclostridium sp.]